LKTIILVPMMYSENDIRVILSETPQDFEKESNEFWNYVGDKLRQLGTSVNDVYLVLGKQVTDPKAKGIVNALQEKGAELHQIEDKMLVEEARAWYLNTEDSAGLQEEFLKDINREISDILRPMFNSYLKDLEVGVVFFEPICSLSVEQDIRVIRMAPFDPKDYLVRHLTMKQLRGK
jgi:hypothetical protein